jgi:hypothetical protein
LPPSPRITSASGVPVIVSLSLKPKIVGGLPKQVLRGASTWRSNDPESQA